eukprot:2351587-Rhodomonas_salina.1
MSGTDVAYLSLSPSLPLSLSPSLPLSHRDSGGRREEEDLRNYRYSVRGEIKCISPQSPYTLDNIRTVWTNPRTVWTGTAAFCL